jgi:hypothetical protein
MRQCSVGNRPTTATLVCARHRAADPEPPPPPVALRTALSSSYGGRLDSGTAQRSPFHVEPRTGTRMGDRVTTLWFLTEAASRELEASRSFIPSPPPTPAGLSRTSRHPRSADVVGTGQLGTPAPGTFHERDATCVVAAMVPRFACHASGMALRRTVVLPRRHLGPGGLALATGQSYTPIFCSG